MVRERRNWTAEEDSLLKTAVTLARSSDSQSLPWNAIALSVPGRTNKDCRKRFHYKISSNVNRGAWTRSEDERLRAAVQKYGSKWSRVALDVGTRNGDQCSKRWKNTIDPQIDRSAWSFEDEQLLIRCVEKIGHNWKAIVNDHFPGRTALQARNQYNQFRRRTGYGSQASTPCSIQSPSQSSTKNRSLSNVAPALHRSRRQQERSLSVDTDLEYEISDDGLSSEDEIDDDDDDRDWSQSQRRMQWDAANDASQMQAIQSLSKDFKTPAMELDPTVESLPYSSMKYPVPDHPGSILEDGQAFEQISDQLLTRSQVSGHSLLADSPSQLDWISSSNTSPATVGSSAIRKQIVIATTCSNDELRELFHTTTGALESVSFTINSQIPLSAIESSQSFDCGARHIVITALCLPEEMSKLMQMVTDTMDCVSFTIN